MITGAFTIAAAVAVMLGYNIRLAAMVLCFIPAYWILYRLSGRTNRKWGKNLAKASSEFESALLEGVDTAGVLRHYNASGFATRRLESRYADLSMALQKSAGAANLFETAVQGVSRMLVCLVLTIGTFYVFKGEITLGQLVGFYSLCSFFTVPLDDMTSSVNAMAKASVAGKRIYEILSISNDAESGRLSICDSSRMAVEVLLRAEASCTLPLASCDLISSSALKGWLPESTRSSVFLT